MQYLELEIDLDTPVLAHTIRYIVPRRARLLDPTNQDVNVFKVKMSSREKQLRKITVQAANNLAQLNQVVLHSECVALRRIRAVMEEHHQQPGICWPFHAIRTQIV